MDDRAAKSDERRPVTILFTDIVGSTAHAEKLDAEEWKEIVNGAHQRVSAAVTRYDGTVAQLLGDGVLAFFGAPHSHEDDPARAVRAALEIQRAMAEYANELRGIVENFQMRVGIHTGDVVVGSVGSAEHSEYLAVGDAVNLAARLQSAAQPGTVLISETTARLVQAVFDLRDLGEISVKGKTEPLRVFEAIQQRANFSGGRGIAGLSSPLVGRARELKQLTDALNELRAGQGQIVFVLGEAGIGKSRLVEEARVANRESLVAKDKVSAIDDRRYAIRFLEGRALSYGQSLSFWMITQLLQNDLGIADGEHEIKIRVALRKRVQELFAEKRDDVFPYLAHLLGVKLEGEQAERVTSLDGETLKRQILISIADHFLKLAQQQPTVLVLEDLHWADPSSLDALERLLRVTERAPLMIVALMRAETDKPAWRFRELAAREYRRRFHEIELEPLSADDANDLVNHLLAISDLPDALQQMIQERAEGNPLFLEEILRALMEQGIIERDEHNHWHAKSPISSPSTPLGTSLQIPDTLHALLLARIDRLEDDVKRTLQLASVIGRSFLFKLLEAISDAERELDWHLAQLERADLVHEKARLPELEYMFKHSLTQEAAYESLVRERRQEFHRRVANALEKIFAERQEEFLGLLAYHFDRAGEKEKAIDYLLRAGDKARLSDAHVEAIGFYERARDLLLETGDLSRAAKTWLKLGLIYHANFEFEKAHEANEKAFALQQELRMRPDHLPTVAERAKEPARVFRYCLGWGLVTLDPALSQFVWEAEIIYALFAGLAEVDDELNVLPHVARSWEVMEDGKRYIFHLRDDFYWTDGNPVTAHDFEWAWKRFLNPATRAPFAELMDAVEGAQDFRLGLVKDPDTVAVTALDPVTLQVKLVKPVAYFLYIVASADSVALPRTTVEKYGAEWYKPEHIVSNGSFRLTRLDKEHATLERNPNYPGQFSGNLDRVEVSVVRDDTERVQKFLENEVDTCVVQPIKVPNLSDMVDARQQHPSGDLGMVCLWLRADHEPLDDIRVRRALVHALDRRRVSAALVGPGSPAPRGGIIPPGMPGHSPEIGLPFDIALARRLLAESGFPHGKGFPPLIFGIYEAVRPLGEEMVRQWHEHLGLDVSLEMRTEYSDYKLSPSLLFSAWIADYPDPDNFLRTFSSVYQMGRGSWQHERFAAIVDEAASTTDRARRMALYREADRLWVAEDVVVWPIVYEGGGQNIRLLKPRVKDCKEVRLGHIRFKDVRIEPH